MEDAFPGPGRVEQDNVNYRRVGYDLATEQQQQLSQDAVLDFSLVLSNLPQITEGLITSSFNQVGKILSCYRLPTYYRPLCQTQQPPAVMGL